MAYSWSDPGQSQATNAALSSQYRVQAGDIGSVLASILRQREMQAQLQQQQTQNMAQAAERYGTQQQQNQDQSQLAGYMADVRQQQLAGNMNPDMSDYFMQFDNPSPRAQVQAQQWMTGQDQQGLKDQLTRARIDAEQAHANALWTYPPGSGGNGTGDTYLDQLHQQNVINQQRKNALDSAGQNVAGIVGYDDLPSVMAAMNQYKAGQTAFPLMQGNATPGQTKDQLINAVNAYRQTLQGGSPGTLSQSPSQPKNDVGQYPVGTRVQQGNQIYEKQSDGSWQPVS